MDHMKLIRKVLSGTGTESDRKSLYAWIGLLKSNQEEYQNVKLLWETSHQMDNLPYSEFHEGLLEITRKYNTERRRQRYRRAIVTIGVWTMAMLITFLLVVNSKDKRYARFDDASVAGIISDFKDNYKLQIEVHEDIIGNCRFTGTFYNTSSKDMLKSIAASLGLTLQTVEAEKFLLAGKGCTETVTPYPE